jgi:hypothetical protein
LKKVVADSKELCKTLQRGAELTKARRYGRLNFPFIKFAGLGAKEPAKVEGTQVAARKFFSNRDHRGKIVLIFVPVAAFVIAPEGKNNSARLLADDGAVARAILLRGFQIE